MPKLLYYVNEHLPRICSSEEDIAEILEDFSMAVTLSEHWYERESLASIAFSVVARSVALKNRHPKPKTYFTCP